MAPISNSGTPRRPVTPHLGTSPLSTSPKQDLYSDARTHGYQGPTRHVRLTRATSAGGGAIARNLEDGIRCIVAGRETLRILRITGPSEAANTEHRSAVGQGGYRIEASRNFWDSSGLHIDSASTDVVWCHGMFSNKILTSARNGELIMWDLNKSGPSKYERKSRDHSRSIHALAYSPLAGMYCFTGSADGDLRVWDLRDLSKSIMFIRHASPVRAVALSPRQWKPLEAITALENGTIFRWDLSAGQRGHVDRIPAAHSGPVLTLDWTLSSASSSKSARHSTQNSWYSASGSALGLLDDIMPSPSMTPGTLSAGDNENNSSGWLASGGLDRCVKVWDMTVAPARAHISHQPAYTLRTAFPVRRVHWRPGYDCEMAVISSADYNPNMDSHSPTGSNPAISGGHSSSGFLSVMSSPRIGAAALKRSKSVEPTEDRAQLANRNIIGDAIEIWDVRRGHIAKWEVNESAAEGGVTDVVFADSHTIWSQHSSGTFSQFDLRYSCKPIDAISRVAVAWDAAGSLAFVTDKPNCYEVPYDDLKPEKKSNLPDRQGNNKSLGDPQFVPNTQNVGTLTFDGLGEDMDTFAKLAQEYIYEGKDRQGICEHNAKVSMEAGKSDAAQAWLLLRSLLTDLVQPAPADDVLSPLGPASPALTHSASTPASFPTLRSLSSALPPPSRSMSSDLEGLGKRRDTSPASSSHHSPHRVTPTSSTTSSPHHPPSALPQYPASLFARRESNAGLPTPVRSKMPPSYRRPSFAASSIYSMHSDAGSDSVRSHQSLKLIGEGALDDSDSDSGEDRDIFGRQSVQDSGEDTLSHPPPITPYSYSRNTSANPSPLSQVVDQHAWTEDERDEDDSPSPGSTSSDSDSDYLSNSSKRKLLRSSKHTSTRSRAHSRSSTVASFTASSSHRTLTRRESHSSMRTVTAVNPFGAEHDRGIRKEDTIRDWRDAQWQSGLHQRTTSEAVISESALEPEQAAKGDMPTPPTNAPITEEFRRIIQASDWQFRELGWESLREAFETFTEEGDIQLCAFMSIVASRELRVSQARMLRFIESYINILGRLRLHTSAAYMRKFVEAEDIRVASALNTTIYTSCGRCRKPIMQPAVSMTRAGKPAGSYAYCLTCKKNATKCSICHLPVRALMFQCPGCMHGGHQECYLKFYLSRPLTELNVSDTRGRNHIRSAVEHVFTHSRGMPGIMSNLSADTESDTQSEDGGSMQGESTASGEEATDAELVATMRRMLYAHPCAAGCGHFCWAVSR
ncbi:hypothetical protein WOLCODRAFT_76205 [Wolfiporia cocos MD-104 SS10]|uniref:Uncharacterized protein n=1 Tax=Wolfiporia cocos (strain MD-104) TaxID=742152 RepID=A0A2H3JPF0_WOLCO|nr:hypothetical protein WOLCODRAFT_76205 [Wolfiporia cocos MD-104 SS10]